jgi:hypothetical protein
VKPDGTAKLSNSLGSLELLANGNFVINQVVIEPNGNITTPGNIQAANVTGTTSVTGGTVTGSSSLKVGSLEMGTHDHNPGPGPSAP